MSIRNKNVARKVFGDWQTPTPLARQVMATVHKHLPQPASVVEPTCGEGTFLEAAATSFPNAQLLGFDISPIYVARARTRLASDRATVAVGDFFTLDWRQILGALPEPIMIVGNPPWVTSATQGVLNANNLPKKTNFQNAKGLDALTGKSNFDISEAMLLQLLQAVGKRRFCLAVLCKAAVARRLMQHVASSGWLMHGQVHTIDARVHFAAAVDAVLLVAHNQGAAIVTNRWPVYASLTASVPQRHMGVIDGHCYSDLDAFASTQALEGPTLKQWRSGIKHDCAAVMELKGNEHDGFFNGLGEAVPVAPGYIFPLLKGSDLAKGSVIPRRHVIVPQKLLGDDTTPIQTHAPQLWEYLRGHLQQFVARKSRIYRNQPPFAIFGVGSYAFAPYKVAICGLYKQLRFTVVPPFEGKPVMVDDTAYLLPCGSQEEAEALAQALSSKAAKAFFEARVFWDAKRPINKALLQSLAVERLLEPATARQNFDGAGAV